MNKKIYVYNMDGLAIMSEQENLKFPCLGSADNLTDAENICDNFVLPEEKETAQHVQSN